MAFKKSTGPEAGPELQNHQILTSASSIVETPAGRGRGAGNRSAETDRAGVPEGPSPRRQTSDKKFQTLTASFREPEM